MYSRYACHLCEDMLDQLREFSSELFFTITVQDIDDSPVLRRLYNEAVPVLMHNNVEICRHFLDLATLRKTIEAERCVR